MKPVRRPEANAAVTGRCPQPSRRFGERLGAACAVGCGLAACSAIAQPALQAPTQPAASPVARAAPPTIATADLPIARDATFLDGAELGTRLLHNVVRIDARDIGEHGYGLVVGADAQHVYVLTARHVVVRAAAGGSERAQARDIVVRPCAGGRPVAGERIAGFDAGDEDIALLRYPKPADYAPEPRALAPAVKARDEAWLLGRDGECAVVPRAGAVASTSGNDVLVDLPGVRGGSSGAPVLTGAGIVGIAKDSDEVVVIVHNIAHAAALLRRQQPGAWSLQDARNVPPTDPRAAQIDLAETLNRYLFAVRDVQSLLQQPVVARATFTEQVGAYNAAVQRFRDARDKYDGTLRRHWPPTVVASWATLRDQLWDVHLNFYRLNAQNPRTFQSERTTPDLRARMQELEPALVALESGMRAFLQSLATRSNEDDKTR